MSLTGGSTAAPTFTAPSTSSVHTLRFRLTVTDNDGATDTDTVDVSVGALLGSQSVTVDLTGVSVFTNYIRWSDNQSLGSVFSANDTEQILTVLDLNNANPAGQVVLSIVGFNNRFTSEFEAAGRIIIEASDGELLEVTIGDADITEPYQWVTSNVDEVVAFVNHVRALSDRNATLTLTHSPVGPNLPSVDSQEDLEDVAISTLTLPEATVGNAPLTYEVSGLPPGLTFASSTRRVTGTPTTPGTFTVTYTVEDDDGDTDEQEFTWIIIADTTPSLPSAGPYTRSGSGNITRILPAATGGNSPLVYRTTENDADGSIVSFNASSRQIIVNIPSAPATLTIEYEVEDSDGDTDSIDVEFRSTVTSVVPSAPAIPTLIPAVDSLIVEWAPPSSIGTHSITSYDIQHRQGTSGDFTLVDPAWSSGPLSYTILGLSGGQAHQVQVRAVSSAGVGSWSSIATATTLSTNVPGRPDAPTLADSANQLLVTWDPPDEDGGEDISAYDIRHRQGGSGWTTIDDAWTGGARTYTITGLIAGATYDVQVRAVNSIGNGPLVGVGARNRSRRKPRSAHYYDC